jgi:acetylornithine deacetylase/succinyl-diaminopimelate desuccinylase-like protein
MQPAKLFTEIEDDVTSLLSDLIRIDTTNPPGNETKAARYVAEYMEKEGFECKLYESQPERGSVITRIKGTQERPRLLLLSHLDVVAANPAEWSVDPFGGLIKDGFVWGRGALDMKGMTAIEMMTMKLLKKKNIKLKGDVILAATADEEKGGHLGADYLLKTFPEEIFAEIVLNEGGGSALPTKHKNLYSVQTSEKGILWIKIKTSGVPGHGSMPNAADNAILRMSQIIEILGSYRPPIALLPTVKEFLDKIKSEEEELDQPLSQLEGNPDSSDEILQNLPKSDDYLKEEIQPRIRMTITPTTIRGGVKENVIPSECETTFDCRILPGQTTTQTLQLIKELLREVDPEKWTIETIQAQEPSESPVNTPLFDIITTVLGEFDPNCAVTPMLMTGGTDSRFFRKMDSNCYGFHPRRPENPIGGKIVKREHGIDERISVENLIFGTSVLFETVRRFMS